MIICADFLSYRRICFMSNLNECVHLSDNNRCRRREINYARMKNIKSRENVFSWLSFFTSFSSLFENKIAQLPIRRAHVIRRKSSRVLTSVSANREERERTREGKARARENERDAHKGYRGMITIPSCHFLFFAFTRWKTISNHGNWNRSISLIMFGNETWFVTTASTNTTKSTINNYVKNHPFDSWYIGGLLFMLTVILVLLYADYYRENAFQILWYRFLTKLGLIQPATTQTMTSSNPAMNTVLIWWSMNENIRKRSELFPSTMSENMFCTNW